MTYPIYIYIYIYISHRINTICVLFGKVKIWIFQFNSIRFIQTTFNKQYNLRLYKHAIHVMLFGGNTEEVKNL